MAATTLADLVSQVAHLYGKYQAGTATGGSTSTVVDTAKLIEVDDGFNGCFLYIVDTTDDLAPEGEERAVSDTIQSTHTVQTGVVFTAAVGAGDKYEISVLRRDDIIAAINAGIQAGSDTWLVYKEDTSLTVNTSDYDLTGPTDLVKEIELRFRTNTGDVWQEFPRSDWEIGGTIGAQEVRFLRFGSVPNGDKLLLRYRARQAALSSDSDAIAVGIPQEVEFVQYIVQYALYWLHRRAAGRGGDQMPEHITLYEMALEEAEAVKARAIQLAPAGKARPALYPRSDLG